MHLLFSLFFFNDTATTEIYTLSLHDALPICMRGLGLGRLSGCIRNRISDRWNRRSRSDRCYGVPRRYPCRSEWRSEEHTSELQSQSNLVCRLLLEKKKKK